MPVKCKKCTTLTQKVNKAGWCDKCRLKDEADKKLAAQKIIVEKELKERQAVMVKMAADAKKKTDTLAAKNTKISEIATLWRGQVKAISEKVASIRHANKDVKGVDVNNINAGNNGKLGTTLGGTDNPLTLVLPANTFGIIKSEVFALLKPDNSDSGRYKFRFKNGEKDIMVHCA